MIIVIMPFDHVHNQVSSILNCSLLTDSKRALKAWDSSRRTCASPRTGYVILFVSLRVSVQPQEAEFCIFRGRNDCLISPVLMPLSHFLATPVVLLHTVPQHLCHCHWNPCVRGLSYSKHQGLKIHWATCVAKNMWEILMVGSEKCIQIWELPASHWLLKAMLWSVFLRVYPKEYSHCFSFVLISLFTIQDENLSNMSLEKNERMDSNAQTDPILANSLIDQ